MPRSISPAAGHAWRRYSCCPTTRARQMNAATAAVHRAVATIRRSCVGRSASNAWSDCTPLSTAGAGGGGGSAASLAGGGVGAALAGGGRVGGISRAMAALTVGSAAARLVRPRDTASRSKNCPDRSARIASYRPRDGVRTTRCSWPMRFSRSRALQALPLRTSLSGTLGMLSQMSSRTRVASARNGSRDASARASSTLSGPSPPPRASSRRTRSANRRVSRVNGSRSSNRSTSDSSPLGRSRKATRPTRASSLRSCNSRAKATIPSLTPRISPPMLPVTSRTKTTSTCGRRGRTTRTSTSAAAAGVPSDSPDRGRSPSPCRARPRPAPRPAVRPR